MKKPKIRFKGFTETWEQRKFKNIVERLSESYMSDDKNPSVEYEDIISELGTINKDIFNKRIRKNGIKFSNNEILYGKLRPYLHNWLKPDFNGIAVGDWWVLKPINCDREFIFRLIQTSTFDNIANQSNGTKMPRADWNLIANSDFYLPISIYEQKQIGSLFSKLDHLITLHQRKCENLKKLKKFMLQKLFPQNGENVPKVRFLNFTDTWEQRKLETYLQEYNEVTSTNNQYPALTSSRKGLFLQTDYFSGNQVASENNIGYNVVPYGYFTYRHMSDDEVFHFNLNDIVDKGIVSTLYPVFTTSKELDSKYLQYQLNYGEEFSRFARLQKQGGSRTYMYLNKLRKLSLTMPNTLDEQKEISAILSTLDHFITLHQSKCDKLKEVKKYMLQNMFI